MDENEGSKREIRGKEEGVVECLCSHGCVGVAGRGGGTKKVRVSGERERKRERKGKKTRSVHGGKEKEREKPGLSNPIKNTTRNDVVLN